ncbi:MAG: ABC transporter permease, partial [Hungatella sp.]
MNKTRRIEMTVELVRILVAIGIAYGIALVTLFAISEEPIYIIKQFVLGPLSSQRRIGSIINLAIPFTFTGLCFCFM